jgi:hypothetical protein
MTHIAIQEALEGKPVEWMEQVTGEQYQGIAKTESGKLKRILAGEADIGDVHAHCAAINTGIRESTLEVIKDAAYLIQLEKPGEVARRIEEFVQRCERKRAR